MPERVAILEAGQARFEVGLQRLEQQRDREHRENQALLTRIDRNASDAADAGRRNSADIEDIQKWRQGLSSELRGALRIPKILLAATPIVGVVLAIITFLHH